MKSTKDFMSAPQFFQFIIFVAYTVLAIRSSEESLQNLTLESVACFFCLFWELILIYALCHFATNITKGSLEMASVAYNIRWYGLSMTQQKMILPIIRQGQIHFTLDGYIFSSSVETFASVRNIVKIINVIILISTMFFLQLMRSSFSYYVVLRQLSEQK